MAEATADLEREGDVLRRQAAAVEQLRIDLAAARAEAAAAAAERTADSDHAALHLRHEVERALAQAAAAHAEQVRDIEARHRSELEGVREAAAAAADRHGAAVADLQSRHRRALDDLEATLRGEAELQAERLAAELTAKLRTSAMARASLEQEVASLRALVELQAADAADAPDTVDMLRHDYEARVHALRKEAENALAREKAAAEQFAIAMRKLRHDHAVEVAELSSRNLAKLDAVREQMGRRVREAEVKLGRMEQDVSRNRDRAVALGDGHDNGDELAGAPRDAGASTSAPANRSVARSGAPSRTDRVWPPPAYTLANANGERKETKTRPPTTGPRQGIYGQLLDDYLNTNAAS